MPHPPHHAPGLIADWPGLLGLAHAARHLKLQPARGARSVLAGHHASRLRGRGMDFTESRRYQPGDDVRRIDWRVTARRGQTHTKIYTEEKQRAVFLLVDYSASLFFGTRTRLKSVTATEVAALLAWVAVGQGDRVGGVIAARENIMTLKPCAGPRGALKLLRALSDASRRLPQRDDLTASPNHFGRALEHLARVTHPGSLVVLLSDFYALNAEHDKLLRRLRAHNDLIAAEIIDPIEQQVPPAGRYTITDGTQTMLVDTASARGRRRYLQQLAHKSARLSAVARGLSMSVLSISNAEPTVAAVRKALAPVPGRLESPLA